MAKKYTADTFEGAVTGTASGNVAKAGDTMTGNLAIENTSAAPKLTIGDTDNTGASQSGASLEMGNRTSNGLTGGSTINLINGSFSQGSIQFRHGNTSTLADPRTMVSSGYTGSTSDYELKFTHYNGSNIDNYTSMRAGYTYFNKPIRIGADAAANELDDYEEGDWTPQMGGYFGGFTLNSYITQQGKYIKIGPVVHLFFEVEFTGVSSGTNLVYLFGLPFAPSDTTAYTGGSIGVRNKKNIDFIVSGQYDSLLGTARLGTVGSTQMFFNMDNGTGTNTLRTNSLTGSNTDSMALKGNITYRTSN